MSMAAPPEKGNASLSFQVCVNGVLMRLNALTSSVSGSVGAGVFEAQLAIVARTRIDKPARTAFGEYVVLINTVSLAVLVNR